MRSRVRGFGEVEGGGREDVAVSNAKYRPRAKAVSDAEVPEVVVLPALQMRTDGKLVTVVRVIVR